MSSMSERDLPSCFVKDDNVFMGTKYRCMACINSRRMEEKGIPLHQKTLAHITNLAKWEADQSQQERATRQAVTSVADHLENQLGQPHDQDAGPSYTAEEESAGLSNQIQGLEEIYATDQTFVFEDHNHDADPDFLSDSSSEDDEMNLLRERDNYDQGDEAGGVYEGGVVSVITQDVRQTGEEGDWYPFKRKMELMGLLLIGTTHNLLSQTQFEKVRGIMSFCGITLPEWSTLRAAKNRLKSRLGFEVKSRLSPLGTPYYNLPFADIIRQELSNPIVRKDMIFYPEVTENGRCDRFAQSAKWREGYGPFLRVPMVEVDGQHFFVYEPVEIIMGRKVVPIFFYNLAGQLWAKVVTPSIIWEPARDAFRIELALVESFNSPLLESISVSCFRVPFPDIEVTEGVKLKDKCGTHMYGRDNHGVVAIDFNPWRHRANGRLIHHVPIVLYSDDTSGNVSKKFNKHMAFYFTLAGLPPKLTNQEYNIHFVSASNVASAMELGDGLVDELNELSDKGMIMYDPIIDEEVLVMVVVLCYVGDSPMHAEVTNTMNPANALTPCRICSLRADKKVDKKAFAYVAGFVGVNSLGEPAPVRPRVWEETRACTAELWRMARHKGSTLKSQSDYATQHGINDTLNSHFIKQAQHLMNHEVKMSEEEKLRWADELELKYSEHMFNPFLRLNGFDGHQDTPVEILHVILLGVVKYMYRSATAKVKPSIRDDYLARWQSFDTSGLAIPPVIPQTMVKYCSSLVGKEFRIVLQAAPFILFEQISVEIRPMWIALCHLSSYIFQTEITNMEEYLKGLKAWIDEFLRSAIYFNAQWVNKSKFHHLLHLPQSVARFGPPCLFGTENFEGFNLNTRASSVHSNRQSPGRDIAETFNTYRLLRLLLSGAGFLDKLANNFAHSSKEIISIFMENKMIRQAFGYDAGWDDADEVKVMSHVIDGNDQVDDTIPPFLLETGCSTWTSVRGVKLKKGQEVQKGSFISAHDSKLIPNRFIGYVVGLWQGDLQTNNVLRILVDLCEPAGINPFYSFRNITRTSRQTWIGISDIEGLLNVQHNCHDSACPIARTRAIFVERTITNTKTWEVNHKSTKLYVLNSGAFHSAELHRYWANIPHPEVSANDWQVAITHGLKSWDTAAKKKQGLL